MQNHQMITVKEKTLLDRFQEIRRFSETICEPLSPEDCVIQSMPDVSPTRWHLAHVTWFFETFVLVPHMDGYRPYHPDFVYLFNSYYNKVGKQFPRPDRGILSRPTVREIMAYRHYVDAHMGEFLNTVSDETLSRLSYILEIGFQHEQQHQELMLTDIKHVFSCNPLYPVYRDSSPSDFRATSPLGWRDFEEGVFQIGHSGEGFSFDNEFPRHREFLESFRVADRLVTNGEYLEFVEDGGYRRPDEWLSLGWATASEQGWEAPLYWEKREDGWWEFTLSGLRPLNPASPVCHVSYFEANAYAQWASARLLTEAEWEVASSESLFDGNFADDLNHHPLPLSIDSPAEGPAQMFGDIWEWTSSAYSPYPGYQPPEGALGEYNGKFMCNQYVLRGGSCATSKSHIRPTYRNFFPPDARWQFCGIRLAR